MDNLQTQVQLSEIAQIALTVSDLAEAKAFYENVLGMRFLFDAGTMSFFQCGSVRLMIGTSEKKAEPGGTILYFRVPESARLTRPSWPKALHSCRNRILLPA